MNFHAFVSSVDAPVLFMIMDMLHLWDTNDVHTPNMFTGVRDLL